MHNPIKTEPFEMTLLTSDSFVAELVSGDPAVLWPGLKFNDQPLDGKHQTLFVLEIKGRLRFGELYTYDTLKVTEWQVQPPIAHQREVPLDQVSDTLSDGQMNAVTEWLKGRNSPAWARAANELREPLGKGEPFYSVAEASRRANIPITTLDSAVRANPQRVPAARDSRGMYCVRMSALNRAIKVGRVRSGVIKRRRRNSSPVK